MLQGTLQRQSDKCTRQLRWEERDLRYLTASMQSHSKTNKFHPAHNIN